MEPESPQSRILFLMALAAVVLAPVGTGLTMLFASPTAREGLLFLCGATFCFGLGEIRNHPPQKGNVLLGDRRDPRLVRIRHRQRNVSGLGNFLVICSLLLFFVGLGKLLTF